VDGFIKRPKHVTTTVL